MDQVFDNVCIELSVAVISIHELNDWCPSFGKDMRSKSNLTKLIIEADSNILTKEEKEKLSKNPNFTGSKWKLLYRGSDHDFKLLKFYTQCTEKKNVVVIVYSTDENVLSQFYGNIIFSV